MKKIKDATKQAHYLKLQSYSRKNRMQRCTTEAAIESFRRKPYYSGKTEIDKQ